MTKHRRLGLSLMLVLVGMAAVASAADRELAVGRWYGEVAIAGTYKDKSFDFRRWLKVNFADGTGETTMRYYLGDSYQTETVEKFRWEVLGDVYWEQCTSVRDDAGTQPCSSRTEYDIKRLSSREFHNVSRRSGIEYREIKVPEQFRLP